MTEQPRARERIAGQSAMTEVVATTPRSTGPVQRLFGADPLPPEQRAVFRGAEFADVVGQQLDTLGQRWDVLHDVPLVSGSLSHLVIGPAGVFAVRSVDYGRAEISVVGGSIVVDGDAAEDLALIAAQAQEVAERLEQGLHAPVRVRPLLVVWQPRKLTVVDAVPVRVVASPRLLPYLQRAGSALSGDRVAAVSDVADRPGTWAEPAAVDTADPGLLRAAFARVRAQVRSARRRRAAWIAACVVVGYTAAWAAAAWFAAQMML